MPEVIQLNLNDRTLLQAMRDGALQQSQVENLSENWVFAYLDLAKALDYLDAMIARTQLGQANPIIKPSFIRPSPN